MGKQQSLVSRQAPSLWAGSLGSVGEQEWHYMITRGRKDVREICGWDDSQGIVKTETRPAHGQK